MTVGASSHFASFVLKQVLDALSFTGQLQFKVIVHFSPLQRLNVCVSSFLFKASLGRQLGSLTQRARFLVISASCLPSGSLSFFSSASTSRFGLENNLPMGKRGDWQLSVLKKARFYNFLSVVSAFLSAGIFSKETQFSL